MCAQRTGLLIPFLNQESVSEEEHTEMMIHLLHAAFVYQAPDGEVEALRDVSLDVEEGEFCSIVGPSGCGKSTLLSVLAGLETLTGGEVTVDGEALPLAEHLGQCDPGSGRPGGEYAGKSGPGPEPAGALRPVGLPG